MLDQAIDTIQLRKSEKEPRSESGSFLFVLHSGFSVPRFHKNANKWMCGCKRGREYGRFSPNACRVCNSSGLQGHYVVNAAKAPFPESVTVRFAKVAHMDSSLRSFKWLSRAPKAVMRAPHDPHRDAHNGPNGAAVWRNGVKAGLVCQNAHEKASLRTRGLAFGTDSFACARNDRGLPLGTPQVLLLALLDLGLGRGEAGMILNDLRSGCKHTVNKA